MDRNKLDTLIEKEMFAYLDLVKEHVYDHTMLFVNRNNIGVDHDVVKRILAIVQTAIEDGKISKIDMVKTKIDKHLNDWTESEHPSVIVSSSSSPLVEPVGGTAKTQGKKKKGSL
jgi:hypothetical protein